MKIRTRLALGFAAMLLLMIVSSVVAITNLNRIDQSMELLTRQTDRAVALGLIRADVLKVEASLLIALQERSEGVLTRVAVLIDNLNDEIAAYLTPQAGAGDPVPAASSSKLAALEEANLAFTQAAQGYLDKAATEEVWLPGARPIMDSVASTVLEATDALAVDERASLMQVQAELQAIQTSTRNLLLAASIVAALLGVLLAITLTRSITGPLAALVRVSDKISTGEIDTPVPVAARDEIGELAESMERMRISLKAVIERLRARSSS
jgi:methyl-accepting chemotaxis protein